jgi:hypothetical protein
MNMTATILIVSRIWWVMRQATSIMALSISSDHNSADFPASMNDRTKKAGGGLGRRWKKRKPRYWQLIVLIIESASFAAVAQIVQLCFYATKFPVIYFLSDTAVQIEAMSPLLIIAFVGLLNRGPENDWTRSTSYQIWAEGNGNGPCGGGLGCTAGNSESQVSDVKFRRGICDSEDGSDGAGGFETGSKQDIAEHPRNRGDGDYEGGSTYLV